MSKTGDNLPNVIQFLRERHAERLDRVFEVLRQRVPSLEKVLAEPMPDGRLLRQLKDAPYDQPILSRFASDGTLKMLAYLIVLYDPEPPQFIGIIVLFVNGLPLAVLALKNAADENATI